jgi:hypothetical protein
MNGIKYETDFVKVSPGGGGGNGRSSSSSPWVTFNGANITDSEVAIEHISKAFNVDSGKNFTLEQEIVAKCVQP